MVGCRSRGLLATVAVAAALVPSAPAAAEPLLPNLVPDPPVPRAPSQYHDGQSVRLLLRFDGYIRNAGPGPVELRGSSPFGPLDSRLMGSVVQRVYGDDAPPGDGSFEDRPSPGILRYETSDGHRHWHLMAAARYSLWDADKASEVGPASKIGFCLADIEAVDPGAAPKRYDYWGNIAGCSALRESDPDGTGAHADSLRMGITPGWRDVYEASLALQWVDVSNVPPGHYWMRSEVDPAGVVAEDGSAPVDVPAFATQASTIAGYVAKPVRRGQVPIDAPSQIELRSDSYGKSGSVVSRRWRIVDAPEHGKLTIPGPPSADGWFQASEVTYTPDPGYSGPDSFRFAARDAAMPQFPREPPTAAATMQVGADGPAAVAISGAPQSLATGASAQLTATKTAGPSPHLTWRVDGTVGGDAVHGTVTQSGLYRAPDAVPPGEVVRVGASAEDGTTAEVAIRIVAAPPPRPAPDVVSPVPTTSRPVTPRRATAQRRGRRVLVRLTAPATGRLRVVVRVGSRRLGGCRVRAAARRRVTCSILLTRRQARVRRGRLRVSASLRVGPRVVERWQLRVR